MNKVTLYILLLLFGSLGVTLKFSQSHEKMPIGCDEFGYLNMARNIRGENLSIVSERNYLKPLLDTLRSTSITENEIAWMITPHAYHLVPETNKIINQYPPGTSLLLSIFPIELRQLVFPLICIFILCLFTIIINSRSPDKSYNLFDLLFPAFIFLMMISAPFTTELSRINSLAPTFGLLFAAGLLLSKNPLAAALLIGLSVNFRVVNALMLVPIVLFLPLKSIFNLANVRENFVLLLKFGLISVAAALPLLFYNYIEMGNPFSITYSSIDKAYNSETEITNHVKYYFNIDQLWFRIHIIGLALLIILNISGKLSRSYVLAAASFVILNYLFFIFHAVKMDYYPYASAIIVLGFIGSILSSIKLNQKHTIFNKGIFIACTIIIFVIGGIRYLKKPHQTFEASKQKYAALCRYDIVWGDLYSGTTEYVCNNNGFRYGTTTPRARKIALSFLKSNNYKQAILLNDNIISEQTILAEIQELGFKYTIINDVTIGKILIIK